MGSNIVTLDCGTKMHYYHKGFLNAHIQQDKKDTFCSGEFGIALIDNKRIFDTVKELKKEMKRHGYEKGKAETGLPKDFFKE